MLRPCAVLAVASICVAGQPQRLALSAEPATKPIASSSTLKVNPKDGAEMVLVPAGEFLMGTSPEQLAVCLRDLPLGEDERKFQDELPQHRVTLDAYYIYKTEVTIAQYQKFCQSTHRPVPAVGEGSTATDPMLNVSWEDATAYAQWAGAALPTEAQWEKAARGAEGRVYPWGNDWDSAKCVNRSRLKPVASVPADTSPYGCLDMAGNAWEWCSDCYEPGYYQVSPARNPTGPANGATRVLRGGSYSQTSPHRFRAASRDNGFPATRNNYGTGFRCATRVPES